MSNRNLTVLAVASAVFGAALALVLPACAAAGADAAAATYGAELDRCVQTGTTQAQIDACRRTVDARWIGDASHD